MRLTWLYLIFSFFVRALKAYRPQRAESFFLGGGQVAPSVGVQSYQRTLRLKQCPGSSPYRFLGTRILKLDKIMIVCKKVFESHFLTVCVPQDVVCSLPVSSD